MSTEEASTSRSNISEAGSSISISSAPAEAKKVEIPPETEAVLESDRALKTTGNHMLRLQELRKELNYISETDWMYDSLEKKPQQ
ncbi:uncharacterized protein Dwil_GK20515 [Drosophila willistoni]|uniref:GK20515 n=1 Tax=Drosophila willistoni TaxID=7260 RepID=B4N568_DROWI|nr:uncharacterized protein LOC124460767 [Drosophila willistoni]EDW79507.1 uncharacterized protein Dwil_GK20515 [Drosophila willistoni]